MTMRIVDEDCTKCGICVPHCHVHAIKMDHNGVYIIDETLCDRCEGQETIQCALVCKPNCIVDSLTDQLVDLDKPDTLKLTPSQLLSLIVIMGSKNSKRYTTESEIKFERSTIAQAFMNPMINVQIQNEKNEISKRIGLEAGQILNFWNAVSIVKQNIDPDFLHDIEKPDEFIEDFSNSISPYDTMERGRPT